MNTCDYANTGDQCRADDGDECAQCEAERAAYCAKMDALYRAEYDRATPAERLAVIDPERARAEYEQEMRDAGREHLLWGGR